MGPLERLAISRQEQGEASPHINATRLDVGGVDLSSALALLSGLDAELALLSGLTASSTELNKLDGGSVTNTELNLLTGVLGGVVEAHEVFFTENATNDLHRGDIAVPAGATILEVYVHSVVLWTATTASLKVGISGGTTDGFFTAVDLKANDLLAGESISLHSKGGVEGAFFVTSEWEKLYDASARVVRCDIAVGTPATTAGRTRFGVVYVTPTAVAATASGP